MLEIVDSGKSIDVPRLQWEHETDAARAPADCLDRGIDYPNAARPSVLAGRKACPARHRRMSRASSGILNVDGARSDHAGCDCALC
jgi:hypothetical protein